MSGTVALQALVSGLGTGAAYGLIALGFTLVRRLTGVIAFAQGDIAVGAVFLAVLVVIGTTPIATTPSAAQTAGLLVLALLAGGALSVLVYLAALRPFLGGGDVIGWVAGGLAAGLAIRGGADAAVLPGGLRDPGRPAHHRRGPPGRRHDRARAGAGSAGDRPAPWAARWSAAWPAPARARSCAR